MFDTRTNSMVIQPKNYGNTFSERLTNSDLWKDLGHDILFGSNDNPNLQIATVENGPFDLLSGEAEVKAIEKSYEVYHLINRETGVIEYIGRTGQGMLNRFNQHLLDFKKKDWISKVDPFLLEGGNNLTRLESKILEQQEIIRIGLKNLRNRINGINEKFWHLYGL